MKHSDLKQKVGLVNLGCVRNTVDSQNILAALEGKGHRVVPAEKADIVVVNTCSFIEDARKESVDVILDLIEQKKQGKLKKIIVAGCLSQRYGSKLVKELPEVDAFMGVQSLNSQKKELNHHLTPAHYAYLKICESCFNQCSFCIIPKLKGRFVSRSMESIVDEVKRLQDRGVKELNIVGQDITAYGLDLYRGNKLAELLRRIAKQCKTVEWIRLLYAYPRHVTDELIDVIASEPKICKYLDIPLQHVSDRILKAMNRHVTKAETVKLIDKIRHKIPQAFLRTTFITGFPGETDKDFGEMMEFIKAYPFERLGVFTYSREEGTKAFALKPQVPLKVKRARQEKLMHLQQSISQARQEKLVGRNLKVLIEGRQEDSRSAYVGRSEYDAPDVDGEVYVTASRKLTAGQFVTVKINGAMEYDLTGEAI